MDGIEVLAFDLALFQQSAWRFRRRPLCCIILLNLADHIICNLILKMTSFFAVFAFQEMRVRGFRMYFCLSI